MKKTLLSISCAIALSIPAMADEVAVTFVDNDHYTGDAPIKEQRQLLQVRS